MVPAVPTNPYFSRYTRKYQHHAISNVFASALTNLYALITNENTGVTFLLGVIFSSTSSVAYSKTVITTSDYSGSSRFCCIV